MEAPDAGRFVAAGRDDAQFVVHDVDGTDAGRVARQLQQSNLLEVKPGHEVIDFSIKLYVRVSTSTLFILIKLTCRSPQSL